MGKSCAMTYSMIRHCSNWCIHHHKGGKRSLASEFGVGVYLTLSLTVLTIGISSCCPDLYVDGRSLEDDAGLVTP